MKKLLLLMITLSSIHLAMAQLVWSELGGNIDGATGDGLGATVSMSADGTIVAIGAPDAEVDGVEGSLTGLVKVYKYESNSWTQVGSTINGTESGSSFGRAISLSADGTLLAVSAPNYAPVNPEDLPTGGDVKVYRWSGSSWDLENHFNISDTNDAFGESLSLSGDGKFLAVGCSGISDKGLVMVYSEDAGEWSQRDSLVGGFDYEVFGAAVDLNDDGSVLAISASGYEEEFFGFNGRVSLYEWATTEYDSVTSVVGELGDGLGENVSLSDDGKRLVTGSTRPFGTGIGFVKIVHYDAGWSETSSTTISSSLTSDAFGGSAAISGDGNYVIVGAPYFVYEGEDAYNESGRAEVYSYSGGTWSKAADDLTGEAENDLAGLGVAVSADGTRFALGIPGSGSAESFSPPGKLKVYELGTCTPPELIVTAPDAQCGAGTVTFTASTSDGEIQWYDAETGGTLLGTGTTFEATISETTTYWVVTDNGVCVGDRVPYEATVHPLPAVDLGEDITACGEVILDAGVDDMVYDWALEGTEGSLGTEKTLIVTESGSYVVAAFSSVSQCLNYDTISVTIVPTPTIETGSSVVACAGEILTLTVTPSEGATVEWYDAATAGTLLFTGADFTPDPAPTEITSYWAVAVDGECESEREEVEVTVRYCYSSDTEGEAGDGSEGSPFLISTKADLKYLSEHSADWGYHFEQIADIQFEIADFEEGGDFYNGGAGFSPIGTSPSFTGSYDGGHHIIDGLKIIGSSSVGFFGNQSGTIRRMGLININVSGESNVGGLVGHSDGFISDSYCEGTVQGNEMVGGLVGYQYPGHMTTSYFVGTVQGNSYTAGLVGWNGYSEINNSYAVAELILGEGGSNGALVGWSTGLVNHSYAAVEIGELGYIGLIGQETLGGSSNNSFLHTNVGGGTGITTAQMQDQATFTGWDFVGETTNGTEDIWQMDVGCVNNGFPTLAWQDNPQPPVLTVMGGELTIEFGDAFNLEGMAIAEGGTVSWYTDSTSLTPLAQLSFAEGELEGGTYEFWASAQGEACAAPRQKVILKVSYFYSPDEDGQVGDGSQDRPFIIETKADLKYLSENSDQWGYSFKQTENIVFEPSDYEEGGDFYNDGEGFGPIGNLETKFIGRYNGGGHFIDGLKINMWSGDPMDLQGGSYAGLFGYTGGGAYIVDLGLENLDIVAYEYVGGLVGYNTGYLESVYTKGSVIGYQDVGGVLGYFDGGKLNESYSTCDMSGSQNNVGGLVGNMHWGTLEDCYATGVVTGANSWGGVIGLFSGGMIGLNYWDIESSNREVAIGATEAEWPIKGLTTAQLQTRDTLLNVGWNFINTWQMPSLACINDGYPVLSWEQNDTGVEFTVQDIGQICSGESAMVVIDTEVPIINWYASRDAAEPVATGDTLITDPITVSTNYWVEMGDEASCLTVRKAIPLTVTKVTVEPIVKIARLCGLEEFSIAVTPSPDTAQVRWYSAYDAEDTLATGHVFSPENVPTESISYWVDAVVGDCASERVEVKVTAAYCYSGGAGTPDNPFLITNLEDLKYLSEHANDWAYHFRQTENLSFTTEDFNEGGDFYNEGFGFNPIGAFKLVAEETVYSTLSVDKDKAFAGVYDGDGHSIDGLTISRSAEDYVGMFRAISGKVMDLQVINADIEGANYVGSIAGYNASDMSGCFVSGTVKAQNGAGKYVGGLIGFHEGVMSDCSVDATVEGEEYVGGAVGAFNGAVQQVEVSGTVAGLSYVGGIAGYAGRNLISKALDGTTQITQDATITNCHNQADISSLYSYEVMLAPKSNYGFIGGIAGINFGTISHSSNQGIIKNTGSSETGGIAGENQGPIFRSYNIGSVLGGSMTGGLVGKQMRSGGPDNGYVSTPRLEESYNLGTVSGASTINSVSVSGVTVETGFSYGVGGLVGLWIAGDITNSFNHGSVTGVSSFYLDISPFVGASKETFSMIGGVVGSYGQNAVSGLFVGGQLLNSYNAGVVTGGEGLGGVMGTNPIVNSNHIALNTFWDIEASGHSQSKVGTGKTTAEMQTQSTFESAEWDFTGDFETNVYPTWVMDNGEGGTGYPILYWQSSPTYTVSGTVTDENGEVFTAGKVSAFIKDKAETRKFDIDESGNYSLNLLAGTYYVKVTPDEQSKASYYLTYLGNTVKSDYSTRVTVSDRGITGQDIQMIAVSQDSLLTGEGKVRGRVLDGDGTTSGQKLVMGRILEGTPLMGVSVFLIRVSDDKVMTEVVTDENGDFEIVGIPEGEYQLQVNIDGVAMDLGNSTLVIDTEHKEKLVTALVSETGIVLEIDDVVDETEEEEEEEEETVLGLEDLEIKIYPNPVVGNYLYVSVPEPALLTLRDVSGRVLLKKAVIGETQLDMRGISPGIHFLEIETAQGKIVKRISKTSR